eukprot:265075-Chlamydomonas_euryale.AAC.1
MVCCCGGREKRVVVGRGGGQREERGGEEKGKFACARLPRCARPRPHAHACPAKRESLEEEKEVGIAVLFEVARGRGVANAASISIRRGCRTRRERRGERGNGGIFALAL